MGSSLTVRGGILAVAVAVALGGCFEADIPPAAQRCSLRQDPPCPSGMVCLGHDTAGDNGRCYLDGYVLPRLAHEQRWFRYGADPLYLLGAGMQSLVGRIPGTAWDGDLGRLLDTLRAAAIRRVRIWSNSYFVLPDAVRQPFLRLPNGLYDLDQWDPAYWSRLRELVRLAQEREMVIEYALFVRLGTTVGWSFPANFWNSANNSNGAFAEAEDHLGFFRNAEGQLSHTGHDLQYYQRRLVQKAAEELRGYGNVYFQILGNPDEKDAGASPIYAWTRELARLVHGELGLLAAALVGDGNTAHHLLSYADDANVDVLGLSTYSEPQAVSDRLHEVQQTGKILVCDDSLDYRSNVPRMVRQAWGWAVSGGHYTFAVADSDFNLVGDATWRRLADATRALSDTLSAVRFWRLSPIDPSGAEQDGLVTGGPTSSWQVLANRGEAYLIYFSGTPSDAAATVTLAAGRSYQARWIDPRQGTVLGVRTLSSGRATVPAPSSSDWDPEFGLALAIVGE